MRQEQRTTDLKVNLNGLKSLIKHDMPLYPYQNLVNSTHRSRKSKQIRICFNESNINKDRKANIKRLRKVRRRIYELIPELKIASQYSSSDDNSNLQYKK